MVNTELFLAFCLASVVLAAMPGPVVALVVANSLRRGTFYGLVTMFGATAGTAVLFTAGALGMAWLISALSGAFDVVRLVGAAYLVYLGVKEWRSRGVVLDASQADTKRGAGAMLGYGFLTGVTNPKTIIFYAAFFPQFVDPSLPATPQLVIMTASFLCLAMATDSVYATLAGRIRPFMLDAKRALIRARITGTLLIATGIGLAFARQDA